MATVGKIQHPCITAQDPNESEAARASSAISCRASHGFKDTMQGSASSWAARNIPSWLLSGAPALAAPHGMTAAQMATRDAPKPVAADANASFEATNNILEGIGLYRLPNSIAPDPAKAETDALIRALRAAVPLVI